MMLRSPPSSLYNNANIHKCSNYKDINNKNPTSDTIIHPCLVVFEKKDMKNNTWLFENNDEDAISRIRELQGYNGLIVLE